MQVTVEGRSQRGRRGSITVEASIIVPLIILSVTAAIYTGLLLYQQALLQSAVEEAAESGAMAWASGTFELKTGKPDKNSFEDFKLYRRLYDSEKEVRLECIEQYALSKAARNELVRAVNSSAQAVVNDYVVCRELEVTVMKEYRLPLGRFLKLFGGSDSIQMEVKANSVIDEPAEHIRTTDFIIDIERKLENKFPELKEFGDKTREALNKIKEQLEQFMG